jgi:hypothetical protein
MRFAKSLGALLLAVSSLAAHAQERSASLEDAERAFADALLRHDRSAFAGLFASDAESSLPVAKYGPEAIADSWLPFLIDPGTTMLLTSTSVTTAPTGDVGNSTGTLAIRGRIGNAIQTLPVGSYSIAWRVVDGRWKISKLGGTFDTRRETVERGGVGGFRFGMTRQEVSQVTDCHPYSHVAVTGGLECPHYQFEGGEINISFIFGGDRLRRIQLWMYEGTSEPEARDAIARVLTYLERKPGGVAIAALPDRTPTPEAVMKLLNSAPLRPGTVAQVVISTQASAPEKWYSRIGRHQHGYMVMLFAEPHGGS